MTDITSDRFRYWAEQKLKKQACVICGEMETDRHHIQYRPEQILVHLCSSCHRKVHDRDGFYDSLEPDVEYKYIPMDERTKMETEQRRGDVKVIRDLAKLRE